MALLFECYCGINTKTNDTKEDVETMTPVPYNAKCSLSL